MKIMIKISCLVFIACIYPAGINARIFTRTHSDGTIEYYNKIERSFKYSGNRNINSKYDEIIEKISEKQGIDPLLIKCIIKIESDFNPEAVSPAGAMGLMQIMQDTANYYSLDDPFSPEKNIETGVKHLKAILGYFKNDIPLSLGAYHAGIGRVKKNMALPPIKATVDYVNAIMYLYTGEKKNYSDNISCKLYKRIEQDGTIVIYSK